MKSYVRQSQCTRRACIGLAIFLSGNGFALPAVMLEAPEKVRPSSSEISGPGNGSPFHPLVNRGTVVQEMVRPSRFRSSGPGTGPSFQASEQSRRIALTATAVVPE
jgi:hypothetical protein